MKRTLMLFGVWLLGVGTTFAAPTPELLEDLTTQILKQQTKTKNAKEVLDQLKGIFTHCATSHKDKTIQSICKSFLKDNYSVIEKKWEKVVAGGLSITYLVKLSNKDRFAYFGLDKIANHSFHTSYIPDEVEYESVRLFGGETFSGLSLGGIGDTSNLIKKPLGVGRNLQRMIEKGEAKVLVCRRHVFLQLTSMPQGYYQISFPRSPFLLGYYMGFDLNNPDGSSSFLSK